jgi:hypothetical protein
MTSKQRLLAAIRFEGPDRVPISPRIWRYTLQHDNSQSTETYLKYADDYGLDPLLTVSVHPTDLISNPRADVSRLGGGIRATVERQGFEDFEVVARTFETPAGRLTDRTRIPRPRAQFGIAPNNDIVEHLVKSPDDFAALECLVQASVAGHAVPDFRAISGRLGERALVAVGTISALSHNAGLAYPLDKVMMDCYDNPAFVRKLISLFQKPLLAATKEALEKGVEAVYCSTYFESMSVGWSPKLYREFFLPFIKEHVDLTHGYGALYHLYDDGKVSQTLPMWREIGVDLVSTIAPPPSGDVTPAQARELAGRDVCLNGGIDTVHVMWRGSPQEIEAKVKEAIEQAALPEGGYIVGTSDSITEQTPVENFEAFFKAARRYGVLGT